MGSNRRQFLELGLASMSAMALGGLAGPAGYSLRPKTVRAVVFDGFPVIDPRPVSARAEELFPGHGPALMDAWRTRQFEYTWLRTLSNRYSDFWRVTDDALTFATKSLKLSLTHEQRDHLLGAYLELKAWPDAAPVLKRLKAAGFRLAFLSNFTAPMLDAAIKNSSLEGCFEPHLTTDLVKAFKPDPRAYQMGTEAFGLKKEQIAFIASAGWDAAGAAWFGYPTLWVNRQAQPNEELGIAPASIGKSLEDLIPFLSG